MDISAFILSLATKFPVLLTIISAVGMLRLILKPTFSYLHLVLGAVHATSLDKDVTIVEQSMPVKWLYYALDWIASVKIAAPSIVVAVPQVVGLVAPLALANVTQTVTKVEATEAAVQAVIDGVKK